MALLELKDVGAAYGSVQALRGVSCAVDEGSIVAVLGANGAGKTTTLRSVSGTVKVTGDVLLDGNRINGRKPEDVARLGVAHVPEGRGILGDFTVLENLRMGAWMRRDKKGIKADLERVLEYFPWLKPRGQQLAASLSGGQQQQLAIARALMARPRLLLLDEPSLGLAPRVIGDICRLVQLVNKQEGITVLIVEQNARAALLISEQAYVMEAGGIVVSGPSDKVLSDEGLRKSYLGY
ncbi:MAG: ABC transporter ATP-binding protein [Candidatus Dormiibacterota bacterium]